jgi:hypothetical protein
MKWKLDGIADAGERRVISVGFEEMGNKVGIRVLRAFTERTSASHPCGGDDF